MTGIRLRELRSVEEHQQAEQLLAELWGRPEDPPVVAELLVALARTGNFVAGAHLGDTMVGASVGFLGHEDGPVLHSHITGVAPAAQRQRVGFELKCFQWRWARARGLAAVTWTFDPLVRRNGWFNLVRLGAVATAFEPNLYGNVDDRFNAGAETDRCWVRWDLAGEGPSPRGGATEDGATVVLGEDPDGGPVAGPLAGDLRLVRVPADIVDLRARRPDLAEAWRTAVGEALGGSMADGFVATNMTGTGSYLLEGRA